MGIAALAQGYGMGLGLIVAIGAQNAFVLSQGIRRNHHLAVAGVCFLCDALLISAGVLGVGAALAASPTAHVAAAFGGSAFLFWYGLRSLRQAFSGGALDAREQVRASLKATLAATLAVTLLNPHVYIDTVLLVGGVSARFGRSDRLAFGAGAVLASLTWFFALGLGGRLLAPLFRRPATWVVLDGAVGLIMWGIALSLLRQGLAAC